MIQRALTLIAALALLTLPVAADDAIRSGADLWKTAEQGLTHTVFAQEPIPAGFFCPQSPAFDRTIQFVGVPLHTEPEGALDGADTIVHRLQEATFGPNGEARTGIRLLAMWLASPEPVDVGCDRLYEVDVVLDGEQPTTEMKIVRETDNGGYFVSPLALNVKVRFTPVGGTAAERLEVSRQVELGPGSWAEWAYQEAEAGTLARVDADGDGEVDTLVPARGNFRAGVAPVSLAGGALCRYISCHCAERSVDPFESSRGCPDDHLHCTEVWVDCCELLEKGDPDYYNQEEAVFGCPVTAPVS